MVNIRVVHMPFSLSFPLLFDYNYSQSSKYKATSTYVARQGNLRAGYVLLHYNKQNQCIERQSLGPALYFAMHSLKRILNHFSYLTTDHMTARGVFSIH